MLPFYKLQNVNIAIGPSDIRRNIQGKNGAQAEKYRILQKVRLSGYEK